MMNGGAHRQHPIALDRHAFLVTHKDMRGRQPLDIRERRSSRFPDHVEKEKIRNGKVVQSRGDSGMLANAVQRVAEDKQGTDRGIVERFYSEMISRAKQLLAPRVP